MRKGTYLNAVLTVNAVLLSVLVWTQLAAAPIGGPASAVADTRGIPNAAAQRARMITALERMESAVSSLKGTLEGGKINVSVTNLDDVGAE